MLFHLIHRAVQNRSNSTVAWEIHTLVVKTLTKNLMFLLKTFLLTWSTYFATEWVGCFLFQKLNSQPLVISETADPKEHLVSTQCDANVTPANNGPNRCVWLAARKAGHFIIHLKWAVTAHAYFKLNHTEVEIRSYNFKIDAKLFVHKSVCWILILHYNANKFEEV